MYEIFSENSINILINAQDEARKSNTSEVDPINLFIALIQNEKSSASKILSRHMKKKFSNTSLKNKDLIMNFQKKTEISFNSEVKLFFQKQSRMFKKRLIKILQKADWLVHLIF